MKVILKNTNLVFEKKAEKRYISSYDAFGATSIANTGNITYVNASASDKRVQMYDVSAFAGKKVNVEIYFNFAPDDMTNYNMFSFSTSLVSHEDATSGSPSVLVMDNGYLSSEGLSRKWNIPGKPTACCQLTGEINIPAGTKAMAILAGTAAYMGVSYPDNSKVYYYE